MTDNSDPPQGPRIRVRDFPRPPALERERRRITITLGGALIVDAAEAWRVLETTHPPTYYIPPAAFTPGSVLAGSPRASFCEWKGHASYVTLAGGGRREIDAGWTYPEPSREYAAIRDHIAVYAGRMDACTVGGELVVPQPGGFYGGWVTSELEGPFKGGPRTEYW